MADYVTPDLNSSALVTIDVQRDTLDGQSAEIPGTSSVLPNIRRLVGAFRSAHRPIVHLVRIYLPSGSNVDACRRAAVEQGASLFLAGSEGAQLAPGLIPDSLDFDRLLTGEPQRISDIETVMYKPRWGAFYETGLYAELSRRRVSTVVFAGANYPNCPRTSIYEASERDFRIVVVADALSRLDSRDVRELAAIAATVSTVDGVTAALESGESGVTAPRAPRAPRAQARRRISRRRAPPSRRAGSDRPLNAQRLAFAAALVAVSVWASAFVGIRFAARQLAPGPLALARLTVGALALGVVMVLRREPLVRRAGLRGTIAMGVLWFGAYNVALNAAERRVDAGVAALLVNVGPVFIVLLARRTLHERAGPRMLLGCIVAFAGVALIAAGTARHGLGAGLGVGLCLAAAALYAVAVVCQKPAMRHGSALAVTWTACVVGLVTCLPFAPRLITELGRASTPTLLWTAYLGLGPTAVGFCAWAYALARTDAGKLGATTYLVPPIAVLLGWLLLGEVPPLLAVPGGLLCLCGVALARRSAAHASSATRDALPTPKPPPR